MKFIKERIKKVLVHRRYKKYAKIVSDSDLSYDKWIQIQERAENGKNHTIKADFIRDSREGNILVFELGYFVQYADRILREAKGDIVLLRLCDGETNGTVLESIRRQFDRNQNVVLIYGDEDVRKEAERTDPWFKPDWSPDRFLSSFYLGSFLAFRRQALAEAWARYGFILTNEKIFQFPHGTCRIIGQHVPCGKENLIVSEYTREEGKKSGCMGEGARDEEGQTEKASAEEMQKFYLFLYEMIRHHGGFSKRKEPDKAPVCHIRQVLFHSREPGYGGIRGLSLPAGIRHGQEEARRILTGHSKGPGAEGGEGEDVSIIIPSKDNPAVLFCCIHSLIAQTHTDYAYEILIIDNGSTEENRQKIQDELELLQRDGKVKAKFQYIYEPMPFNFSKMCNIGSQKAKGRFFLFLNDDMEIIQEDWLDLMLEKAALPYAGGVGAKLLYPSSSIIQHAGVTNLRVGPAHKLQFLEDNVEHYYGMNRGVHDMLAVTGACLMVRREVFEEAGGFCPELAVAFNDVDLCYTMYEKGYYNIVRNDVILYHHESLSRGKDGESEEKQLRLMREKDLLYERHQELYGKDPFYHPYLVSDALEQEYYPACHYQVTLEMPWAKVKPVGKALAAAREDACFVVGVECVADIYKWEHGVDASKGKASPGQEEMGYYFQGYSFVIGADNACYDKKLLLKAKESGDIFEIPLENRYRQDIKNNLTDQLHVDLTGFAAKLQAGRLPGGVYQLGMLACDRCSRTKLVSWSSWTFEVKE